MKLSSLFPALVALVFTMSVIAAGQEQAPDGAVEQTKGTGSDVQSGTTSDTKGDPKIDGKAETRRSPANDRPISVSAHSGDYDACLANNTVLEDLRKSQQDIEAREKDLRARETDVKAREAAIAEELRKLESLRKDISGLKAARRQKNEEQVAKLIETVEKMSPKTAAVLLARVDEDLAVATMNGVSTDKLAKIMGNMDTLRSVRLSELLAMGENAPIREPSGEPLKEAKETSKGGANGAASRP